MFKSQEINVAIFFIDMLFEVKAMGEVTQRKSLYKKGRQGQSLGVLQYLEEKKMRSH